MIKQRNDFTNSCLLTCPAYYFSNNTVIATVKDRWEVIKLKDVASILSNKLFIAQSELFFSFHWNDIMIFLSRSLATHFYRIFFQFYNIFTYIHFTIPLFIYSNSYMINNRSFNIVSSSSFFWSMVSIFGHGAYLLWKCMLVCFFFSNFQMISFFLNGNSMREVF